MSRTRSLLSLALLSLAISAPGSLQAQGLTVPEIATDLEGDYIGENWGIISDRFRSDLSHSLRALALDNGAPCGTPTLELDFENPPSFAVNGPTIDARFPLQTTTPLSNWRNFYQAYLKVPSCPIVGEAAVRIEFAMAGNIDGAGTDMNLVINDISIDEALIDNSIFDALLGLFTGCGTAEECLEGLIQEEFEEQAAAFGSMRLQPGVSSVFQGTDLLVGNPELDPAQAIDIHLVADGWTSATLPDFDLIAQALAAELAILPDDPNAENTEPFPSWAHAIQVHSHRQYSPGSTVDVLSPDRVVAPSGPDGALSGIGNLYAWSPEYSPQGRDVVVFIADANSLPAGLAASASGRQVLLPADVGDLDGVRDTFIHELGHTVLGNLLDQYDSIHADPYVGFEPDAVNVSLDPSTGKWSEWSNTLSPDPGGLGYPSGLFVPDASSRMGSGLPHAPFDPISRQALTTGIQDRISTQWAEVSWETVFPNLEPMEVEVAGSAAGDDLGVIGTIAVQNDIPGGSSVQVSLLGASLPAPFEVEWNVMDGAVLRQSYLGVARTITVYPGDTVEVTVTTGTLFDRTGYAFPELTVTLETVQETLPASPPPAPTFWFPQPNPRSNFYDANTGDATSNAAVRHASECYPGWSLQCRTDFRFTKGAQVVSQPGRLFSDVLVADHPVGYLPIGTWSVEAQTRVVGVDAVLESPWSLRNPPLIMTGLAYETAPTDPGGPDRLRAYTCEDEARLSADVWDINGDAVAIEFEARPTAESFQGDADPSALLLSDTHTYFPFPPQSTRVRKTVTYLPFAVDPLGDSHHARARWVDAGANKGPWSAPITFRVGGLDDCRGASIRDRLDEDSGRFFERPDWYRQALMGRVVVPAPVPSPSCPDCFDADLTLLPVLFESSPTGASSVVIETGFTEPAVNELVAVGAVEPSVSIEPPLPLYDEVDLVAIEPPLPLYYPTDLELLEGSDLRWFELLGMAGTQRLMLAELHSETTNPASGGVDVDLTVYLTDEATGAELAASSLGSGVDRADAVAVATAGAVGTLFQKAQAMLAPPVDAGLNPCCSASSGPGCGDASVQAAVCATDAYCCDVAWDSICVDEVTSIAGVSCVPEAENNGCCDASTTPGCTEASVEAAVCAVDAYCCDVAWDAICVNEVETVAGGSCSAAGN